MPENWHRRQAIQLAAQLPEDAKDALIVLELTKELVEVFLKGSQEPLDRERPAPGILAFPASVSSR